MVPHMADRKSIKASVLKLAGYAQTFSTVGAALAGLRDKPTVLNAVGIAATVFGNVATHIKDDGVAKLIKDWHPARVTSVNLHALLDPFHVESRGDYHFYKFGGQRVARYQDQYSVVSVEVGADTFVAQLRQHVWALCKDSVQVAAVKGPYEVFDLTEHEQGPVQESERCAEIWARLRPFVEAGEPRALLLDGPPGVGKSTIVRALTRKTRGRLLRVPAADLGSLSATSMTALVGFLRPEVIVIDDFDRAYGQTKMLDFFEQSRSSYRLLIVTTNGLEGIDPAVTRPGRFDELLQVTGLGETFVRDALGAVWERLDEADRAKVALWPAAYLAELRKRDDRIAGIVLADEVAELNARVLRKKKPAWADFMDVTPAGVATT